MSPARFSFLLHMGVVGAIATVGACHVASAMNLPSLVPTYELVMEFRDQRHVLDHDLSLTDCLDSAPRNDPYRKLGFACELEK